MIPAGLGLPTTACPVELKDHELLAMIAMKTAEIAAGGGGGGGGLTAVPVGNTIFVDSANGSASGEPYQLAKPFQTITQAVAVAAAGDTIHVWSGTYSDATINPVVALNFYFEEGAVWNTGNQSISCINDVNNAINVRIDGGGCFFGGAGLDTFGTFFTGNPDSQITVVGDMCESVGGFNGSFRFNRLGAANMNGTDTTWPSLWWQGGNTYITVQNMHGGGGDYFTVEAGPESATDTENLYIRTSELGSQPGNGVLFGGAGNARIWIEADLIQGFTQQVDSGFIYVRCKKWNSGPNIEVGANEFWVDAEKILGTFQIDSGNAILNVGGFDDSGNTGQAFIITTGGTTVLTFGTCLLSQASNYLFNSQGGSLEIREGDFTAIAGQQGSFLNGGKCRISCRIDMSAAAGTSAINIAHGTPNPVLILDSSAKLITDGTAHPVVIDTSTVTIISQGAGNVGLGTGVSATGSFTVIAGLQ